MAVTCGVPNDDGISFYNKCTITQTIDSESVTVVGYLTESCQLSLRSLWESPFEGDSVGDIGKISKLSGIGQSTTEMTSKTQWNSQQVWKGMEPPEITIQLYFYAYSNAKSEVDLPIRYLLQMMSPNLNEDLPIETDGDSVSIGRVPSPAMFDIGGKLKMDMRISEVSYELNAPKTSNGYFAYNTVSITAAPKRMFNASEISSKLL